MDDKLEAVRFQASACAICTASGSLMTGAITGLKTNEATALAGDFRKLATTGEVAPAIESLTALRALGAVHRFPQRVKCATLAWETFSAPSARALSPRVDRADFRNPKKSQKTLCDFARDGYFLPLASKTRWTRPSAERARD